MGVSELSTSTQNYLKAIWTAAEWSDEPVTASVVAQKLGLRLSSVSDAVRKLTEQGLLAHSPYGSVELTETGRSHAVMMVRRHRLMETFLVEILGYGWDEVHDEAEHLEHAVSDLLVDRVDALLGHPTRDPHGDPIPAADGEVTLPDARLLVDAAPGDRVTVERISDSSAEMLQYFAATGILPGAALDVLVPEPFAESLRIKIAGGDEISLGRAAASAIRVSARPH